jgi:hypothetical protein
MYGRAGLDLLKRKMIMEKILFNLIEEEIVISGQDRVCIKKSIIQRCSF